MFKGSWTVGALAALVILGCGPGNAEEPDTSDTDAPETDAPVDTGPFDVSFSQDIAPLFARSACYDCHFPGTVNHYDLMNPFDPETGIVGRHNSWVSQGSQYPLVVDPGNAEGSFLVVKLRELDLDPKVDGHPMPMHLDPLTPDEIAAVETWISNGANADAQFRDHVAPIFGTELSMRRAAGRCTYCHYPDSPSGLNVLDVFDPVQGMVGVDSAFGGKIVDPGNPGGSVLVSKLKGLGPGKQMPLHAPRISPANLQLIIDWIDAGAPDN